MSRVSAPACALPAWLIPKGAQRKLLCAKKHRTPVYAYGAIGFGKTQSVLSVMEGLRFKRVECLNGPFSFDGESYADLDALIIDDLQRLENREDQKTVLRLLDSDLWVILVSRAALPSWLMARLSLRPFTLIDERDLAVDFSQIYRLCRQRQITLPEEIVDRLREKGQGNLSAVFWTMEWFLKGWRDPDALEAKVREQVVSQVIWQLFEEWPSEIVRFLASLCVVDSFTIELAELMSGNPQTEALLRQAQALGSFLFEENGVYTLRRPARAALETYASQNLGSKFLQDTAYNAGLYYELHSQIPQAIAMYEKSGRKDRVLQLLIQNSSCNVTSGHFYSLRRFYLALDEDEIASSPELMCSMAILYDLLLLPEQSEYWRRRVDDIARSASGSRKREAMRLSLYLEMALIHTGSRSMLSIFRKAGQAMIQGGFALPELSVTSKLPSLMNGGKDFSHWSAHDQAIAFSFGRLVPKILGSYGKGFVPLALAESLYEKGGDPLKILSGIVAAEMEIQNGGKLEMAFVAAALKARLFVSQGQSEDALRLLKAFRKKALARQENAIVSNLDALLCRIALLREDRRTIDAWLDGLEDFGDEFFVLNRYQYFTLVRVWIAQEKYLPALTLLDKLDYYADLAQRPMYQIEIGIDRTIILSRMGQDWQTLFLEVLHQASTLRFVPIIACAGPEITDCLEALWPAASKDGRIDLDWLQTVREQSRRFSRLYPHYLLSQPRPVLSENGLQILRLQALGLSAKDIAAALHLKIDNVRYHIKENYRRLQVSSKTEAVLYAREQHLI